MDLTNQTSLRFYYDLDPDTNVLTVTVKDDALVELGTIIIESIKFKTLMHALATMADARITTEMVQTGSMTAYNIQENSAEVQFR